MPDKSKIRTSEQQLRKMLKEENTILNLELAIKKEQFRKTQKTKRGFYEIPIGNNGLQMASMPVYEIDGKDFSKLTETFTNLLNKIGF